MSLSLCPYPTQSPFGTAMPLLRWTREKPDCFFGLALNLRGEGTANRRLWFFLAASVVFFNLRMTVMTGIVFDYQGLNLDRGFPDACRLIQNVAAAFVYRGFPDFDAYPGLWACGFLDRGFPDFSQQCLFLLDKALRIAENVPHLSGRFIRCSAG